MIDLALDPTDTRPMRGAPAARAGRLRVALIALAAAGGLGAFGVAASTVMAGLVAPPPCVRVAAPSLAPPSRAADWPELKDGLPALADARAPAAPVAAKRAEPEAPALRMAALPDPIDALPPSIAAPKPVAARPPVPESPAKRIPVPTPVTVIGPARQVAPLAPARTVSLQQPRPSETVRAREVADPAPAVATPAAVSAPAASAPVASAPPTASRPPEKPQRKAVATRKPAAPAAGQSGTQVVASAEPEPEETEVLGVKLPSLAPAGRKLKEGIDAIGDAVKSVF